MKEIADIYSKDYFVSQNPSVLGYDDYETHAEGLRQVFTDHLAVIEQFIHPPASLVDIGCAYGYFLDLASERGWRAQGVEVSAYASQVARSRGKAPIHTGTVADAGFEPSSFDVATMWDVLEHSFDPKRELAAANRILKPSGYLFLTLPNAGSFTARLFGPYWFGFKKVAEHNYFFSQETLRRFLSQAGFQMVDARRGVWPCSLHFLTTKLAPYSRAASNISQRLVKMLGLEKTVVKFKFIDMFVIAQKKRTEPDDDDRQKETTCFEPERVRRQ